MTYGILNKITRQYFAGFNKDDSVKWTDDKNKAWGDSKLFANAQCSLLVTMGHKAQRKTVLV